MNPSTGPKHTAILYFFTWILILAQDNTRNNHHDHHYTIDAIDYEQHVLPSLLLHRSASYPALSCPLPGPLLSCLLQYRARGAVREPRASKHVSADESTGSRPADTAQTAMSTHTHTHKPQSTQLNPSNDTRKHQHIQ